LLKLAEVIVLGDMTRLLLFHHLNLMVTVDNRQIDLQKVMVLKYLKIVGNMFLV